MNKEVNSVLRAGADGSGFKFLTNNSNRSAIESLQELNEAAFVEMKGWLEKRSGAVPFSWRERWVIVRESFMLWSDVEMGCGDPKDMKERNKFKHINLFQVDSVHRDDSGFGKNKTKFKVTTIIGAKKKEYLWRCKTESDRNQWVLQMQYRVEHA